MHRREFVTAGIAATAGLALGVPKNHESVIHGVRSDNLLYPKDFREFFQRKGPIPTSVRVSEEPGRTVYYVDIGRMPRERAERYLRAIMFEKIA